MKSFAEATKTAEELKSMAEKQTNPREMRYYEHVLGLVELGEKNLRKAVDLFAKACERLLREALLDYDRHQAVFFDGLARALFESGDLEKAQREYKKITQLTTGRLIQGDIYAKSFYMLGKIAEEQGDKASAREHYGKFLDLWKDADPDRPEPADARKRLAGLT